MAQQSDKGYITKKARDSGLFQDLFKEGIDLLQTLSGDIWTDYNEHDPGVTILENLVYALTELHYKTAWPIGQILADSKGEPLRSGDNGFFAPIDMFTTAPITAEDYAKVIIDQIDKVQNAWVDVLEMPVEVEMENVVTTNEKVLYDIKIQKYKGIDDSSLVEEVKRVFHAHRNLGEDLYAVTILKEVALDLHLEVTLAASSIPEKVLAEIYYRVNNYLAGIPRFYSKVEMERQNIPVEEIYEGPNMGGRFIKKGDLRPRIVQVEFEEMKRIITNIEEVVSVERFDVHVNNREVLTEGYYILQENEIAKVEIPQSNDLVGYTMEKIKYRPSIKELMRYWYNIRAENYSNVRKAQTDDVKEIISPYIPLHIDKYYSIREQFPVNYGIGSYGLSQEASPKRKAQALQLKAFLLPFEQLMANYLKQLQGVYDLFDPYSKKYSSYHYGQVKYEYETMDQSEKARQSKKTKEELEKLLLGKKGVVTWEDVLQNLNADVDRNALTRLHKALDNMLSRYAEHFPNDILRKLNREVFGHDLVEAFERELLSFKRKLIRDYAHLGAHRLESFDYTIPDLAYKHCKLVEKLAILLAVSQTNDVELSPLRELVAQSGLRILKLHGSKLAEESKSEIDFNSTEEDKTGSFEIFGDEDDHHFFVLSGNSGNVLDEVLKDGVLPSNFTLKEAGTGSAHQYFVDFKNKEIVYTSKSKKGAIKARARLIKRLQDFSKQSERIYLVEHKLLYPDYGQEVFSFTLDVNVESGGVITFYDTQKLSFEQRNTEVRKLIKDLHALLDEKNNDGDLVESEGKFIVEQGFGKLLVQWSGGASGEMDLQDIPIQKGNAEVDSMALFKALLTRAKIRVHNKVFYGKACVDEDELNGQMTFVLPAWPVRFQHTIFRDLFEQLVFEHAPAYMLTHIKWLNIYDMLEFEERHKRWREALPHKSARKSFSSNAYALFEILADKKNE